jgi:dolichyl-phosphate beta-glucosyltransferase
VTAAEFPSISIVIPCFNELERIGHLFDGIREFIVEWYGPFEIIIVNDASTDASIATIKEQALFKSLAQDGFIQLLNNVAKGKGGALKMGVAAAKHSYILTCDADMATHPLEIVLWQRKYQNLFKEKNIAIASRLHEDSHLLLTTNRRSAGNLFNTIVRLFTGLKYRDTQCGFKLYPSAIAKELFGKLQTMGWAHDVELLLHAKKNNFAVLEFPITWNEREASKINLIHDGLKMITEVIGIKLKSLKRN